jgi:hypothetical protein
VENDNRGRGADSFVKKKMRVQHVGAVDRSRCRRVATRVFTVSVRVTVYIYITCTNTIRIAHCAYIYIIIYIYLFIILQYIACNTLCNGIFTP